MIAGIAGLWADVDYAGEDHAKPNLPPIEADAWGLIYAMPVPPTIVIHTGHGLQAWWLFEEPWMFESSLEREEAQAMIRGWQSHMAQIAKDRGGWVVDATHDLARLMRLPGTFNNKSDPVPVKVLTFDGPALERDSVWDYIGVGSEDEEIFKRYLAEWKPTVKVGNLTLDTSAEPPWEQFRALRDNDPKFKRSLERRRSDLSDQSASSYDMSLASIAVVAGWKDQEMNDSQGQRPGGTGRSTRTS